MSGGTKQQFKQFSITCAEDACLVLGMLISGISVNLEKYKEYASEAESLLESIQEEFVPAKEYDDVNDKLLYRQREILKFTADHQSGSFSYIDLRKILEKHKYISSPLSEEVAAIGCELLPTLWASKAIIRLNFHALEETQMAVSYNRLWKLLIDKKMSKASLRKAAGIAPQHHDKIEP